MSIAMLFGPRKGQIAGLDLDATVQETHRVTARATEHPVEDGATISDHVQLLPDEIAIEGWVSDTPALGAIDLITDPLATIGALAGGRAVSGWDLLSEAVKAREPVKIVTTLKTYDDVILEDLSATRDAARGNSLHFTCRGKVLRIVQSQTVAAPVPKEARGNPTKAVKKPTASAAPTAGKESLLHKAGAGAGLFP